MPKSIFKSSLMATLAVAGGLFIAYKVAIALTAFNPAAQPIGYVAQDEVTNYNLKSGNEVLFRGQYEREFWSGTMLAYRVDSAGNLTGGTAWWAGDAGELISAQNFDSGRLIATMKDDGTAVPFRFGSLSGVQQGFLTSESVLNHLRGDRSNEVTAVGGTLRQRVSVIGDIVHSRPLYIPDATNPTLFVGSNGGMLHAINAAAESGGGGRERWAYVPSMLMPKMKSLTIEPYVHDYFVDGQINMATISPAGVDKRVLVGALGAGGKGLYALNITGSTGLTASTEADVASKVLWEITPTKLNYANPTTNNAYVNLGYTYGEVTIAKVLSGGVAVDAVIVGNGYNDGVGSYAGCTDTTPNYTNCGGNYAAYLYIINANTGQLIQAIKAGADGTALSPNGLWTPVALDSDGDGIVDRIYAGDLDGTMWKFNLATSVTTALLTTSPAQAITATPGVAVHPKGGYMVTFGTGKMLVNADATDTGTHYVYGVWDGAPAANAALVSQTISERAYVKDGVTTRVRRSTSNQPNWDSGATNHKGWRVALPAGERVIGEGSFIENNRFYFTGFNPTIANPVPNTSSVVQGEAWLMELDYLSGGSTNLPFLDLSGNVKLDNDDRLRYIAGDTIPIGSAVGDPILTTDGIPIGKWISIGLLSQPILVQLANLNDTLFNQNPDIIVPYPNIDRGVEGGHFDVEIYYGPRVNAAAATATITVGTAGQTASFPATLGAISVDGVVVVPALTVGNLVNGIATNTNAEAIRSRVGSGFSATRVNNVITITAPMGVSYNGKSIDVASGTSQPLVPGVSTPATAPAAGNLVITDVERDTTNVRIRCGGMETTGAPGNITSSNSGVKAVRLDDLFSKISGRTVNGYTTTCTKGGSPTNTLACSIAAPAGVSACSTFNLRRITASTNTGPSGGANVGVITPASGWTNFAPAVTVTALNGAQDASVSGNTCNNGGTRCTFREHDHEYDDIYDRTGVNFLNASNRNFNLEKAIPSMATPFKVLAQNQYLNAAVRLHIGNPAYLFNVESGYIPIKNYQTAMTLDLASVPAYTRATIGSLALNLPVDAFNNRDWWNGSTPDVRDGLHPTEYRCVVASASATQDGNMYQPVIPPSTVTATGNGVRGYSASTTQLTATGVRHNGAITLQIIRADTPNSAIELSIPNQPEYGWRVKAGEFANYVIAEYTMFHHTKHLNVCYGDAGWIKTPPVDTRACGAVDSKTTKKCAVPVDPGTATDPKIGNIGGGSAVESVTQTVLGDVTTTSIVFVSGLKARIIRTANADGSITIVTRVGTDLSDAGNYSETKETIANKAGAVKSGGDERGLQARTGRISWREVVAP